jgi:hypothetical protein
MFMMPLARAAQRQNAIAQVSGIMWVIRRQPNDHHGGKGVR